MIGPIKAIQKTIAATMGPDELMMQTMEEAAELIQALNKYRRARGKGQPLAEDIDDVEQEMVENESRDKLIEEMVDVQICIKELEYLLSIKKKEEDEWENVKIARTAKRYGMEGFEEPGIYVYFQGEKIFLKPGYYHVEDGMLVEGKLEDVHR